MREVVVEEGEHLFQITQREGFGNSLEIWFDPMNEALRKQRENPGVLARGDVLRFKEPTQRTELRSTDQTHTFVVEIERIKLRIRLLDFDGFGLPHVSVRLNVEGVELELMSDASGTVECRIPRHALSAHLSIDRLSTELPIWIGGLDPANTESGLRARLVNLGYYRGSLREDGARVGKELGWAIEEFQCDYGLKVDGVANASTLAKLVEVHGS